MGARRALEPCEARESLGLLAELALIAKNKAMLHVKSPALAKRWRMEWGPTIQYSSQLGNHIDTIASTFLTKGHRNPAVTPPGVQAGAQFLTSQPSQPREQLLLLGCRGMTIPDRKSVV